MALTEAQLTGRDQSHLCPVTPGHLLQPEAARAFARLQVAASAAGFRLEIASSFRSFERQLAIWNGKACGQRPVHDDSGRLVDLGCLSAAAQVAAILRYSALPGASRHHWGTDLDVYDAAAMPDGYRLQLSPGEVAPGGLFDPLHNWLDEQMAGGGSCGFFRPYARDRGGVAVERWHLSYAPLALACSRQLGADVLRAAWQHLPAGEPLALRDTVEAALDDIIARFVQDEPHWCPVPAS